MKPWERNIKLAPARRDVAQQLRLPLESPQRQIRCPDCGGPLVVAEDAVACPACGFSRKRW